MSHFW